MIRSYRFELVKLRRPGTLLAGGLVALLGALATVIAFATAGSGSAKSGSVSLAQFAAPNGSTRGFTSGMSIIGLLVFVLVVVNITSEYGHGTLRNLLVQQPRRRALLTGKLLALVAAIAVALVAALILSIVTAIIAAHIRGVDTTSWWTLDGVAKTANAYLNALLSNALFSVAATALAVVVRSVGLSLAVGVAWLAPVEQLVKQSWTEAPRVFPGLVFDAVSNGSTGSVGNPGAAHIPYATSLVTAVAYGVLALAVALVSFQRRDVTV